MTTCWLSQIQRSRVPIIAAIATAVFASCATSASSQQRPATLFAVGGIRSEATSDNAVEARKLATAQAQARGLRILMSRITDFRAQARLPAVSPEEAERLGTDIQVRGEGVSGTGYVATFTVGFSERGVRGIVAQAGVPLIEERGPEILIVPVFIEQGAARTSDRNPWRKALGDLDLTHPHVPGRLAPARGDITAAIAKAYLANPSSSLAALKTQYRADYVLFAVAEADSGGDVLNLKMTGFDATGAFSLNRKLKAADGIDDGVMTQAAALAFNTVQDRWKLTRATAATTPSPVAIGDQQGTGGGSAEPVQVTAMFSSLKEWQSIRGKLQKMPGVQNWDLKSLDSESAQIGFDLPGGARRAAELAPLQGLGVETDGQGLVVRDR